MAANGFAITLHLQQWKIWAGVYVVVVGATATINQLSSEEQLGWYFASVILTLPLSLFAICPILFLADVAASATGGDPISGNTFGAAAVVASFIALVTINVVLIRGITRIRGTSLRSTGNHTR